MNHGLSELLLRKIMKLLAKSSEYRSQSLRETQIRRRMAGLVFDDKPGGYQEVDWPRQSWV